MRDIPYFDAWLEYLHEKDKSENTVRAYRQRLLNFAQWFESTNGKTLTYRNGNDSHMRACRLLARAGLRADPCSKNCGILHSS